MISIEWKCLDGFLDFPNKYISNISNIYNPNVNLRLASKEKRDKMFSDPKLDNIFLHFQLRVWFIIIYFLYVEIIHLIRIGEGVGI